MADRAIRYDSSLTALLHPEAEPTVFRPGTAYSEDQLCAEIARLVYGKFESDPEARQALEAALNSVGFTVTRYFNRNGTDAVLTHNPERELTIVAFRGTEQDPRDYATNIDTFQTPWPPGGRVHGGFARALGRVWPDIESALQSQVGRVLYTGHSLGAALATLASSRRRPHRLLTFGSPRVGDSSFARVLHGLEVDRFVNCCDIVCTVPPEAFGFTHVGTCRYIDRMGVLAGPISLASMTHDQNQARLNHVLEAPWSLETVLIREFADHSAINYVAAILGLPA